MRRPFLSGTHPAAEDGELRPRSAAFKVHVLWRSVGKGKEYNLQDVLSPKTTLYIMLVL